MHTRTHRSRRVAIAAALGGVVLATGCGSSRPATHHRATSVASVRAERVSAPRAHQHGRGRGTIRTAVKRHHRQAGADGRPPISLPARGGNVKRVRAVTNRKRPTVVKIGSDEFTPATLTVRAGAPILWVNADAAPHRLIGIRGQPFRSPTLGPHAAFVFAFSAPGSVEYNDALHPGVKGRITIRGQAIPSPPRDRNPGPPSPPIHS